MRAQAGYNARYPAYPPAALKVTDFAPRDEPAQQAQGNQTETPPSIHFADQPAGCPRLGGGAFVEPGTGYKIVLEDFLEKVPPAQALDVRRQPCVATGIEPPGKPAERSVPYGREDRRARSRNRKAAGRSARSTLSTGRWFSAFPCRTHLPPPHLYPLCRSTRLSISGNPSSRHRGIGPCSVMDTREREILSSAGPSRDIKETRPVDCGFCLRTEADAGGTPGLFVATRKRFLVPPMPANPWVGVAGWLRRGPMGGAEVRCSGGQRTEGRAGALSAFRLLSAALAPCFVVCPGIYFAQAAFGKRIKPTAGPVDRIRIPDNNPAGRAP
jgi:hypothetical protein